MFTWLVSWCAYLLILLRTRLTSAKVFSYSRSVYPKKLFFFLFVFDTILTIVVLAYTWKVQQNLLKLNRLLKMTVNKHWSAKCSPYTQQTKTVSLFLSNLFLFVCLLSTSAARLTLGDSTTVWPFKSLKLQIFYSSPVVYFWGILMCTYFFYLSIPPKYNDKIILSLLWKVYQYHSKNKNRNLAVYCKWQNKYRSSRSAFLAEGAFSVTHSSWRYLFLF